MWYCAHVLHYFQYDDEKQDSFLVQENIYLVQATSPDEAMVKGELQGKKVEQYLEGSGLCLNDRPASLRFASVRKVVECQDLDGQVEIPTDEEIELTYSEYIVSSKEEFEKLIHGRTATVDYVGGEDEDDDNPKKEKGSGLVKR